MNQEIIICTRLLMLYIICWLVPLICALIVMGSILLKKHYVAQIKETKEIICIRCTGALIIEPIPHQYSFRYLWVKEI